MLPSQKNSASDSRLSEEAHIVEQRDAGPAPSFLYRLGQSIAYVARSVAQGFERLFAIFSQRQSSVAEASQHVEGEVGRSAISNPSTLKKPDRSDRHITEDPVTNPRSKFQMMVAPLLAPTQKEQDAIGEQMFGQLESPPCIAVIKAYALCCYTNTSRHINSDHLKKAMQGIEKFIEERGALNPITKWLEPAYPEPMKAAGISDPLWKALVAINRLYKQGFAIPNEKNIDVIKIRKNLDENRNLRLLLKIPTDLKGGQSLYKNLCLIHGDEKIKKGILNIRNFINSDETDLSSIVDLAKIWREYYFFPDSNPEFENIIQMEKEFALLDPFYSDIAGF